MNKHIELVEKWLVDNDSVSKEELEANRNAAFLSAAYAVDVAAFIGASTVAFLSAAYAATDAAHNATAASAKAFADAHAADAAHSTAAYAADAAHAFAADAAYWVAEYYKLVKKEQDNE